MKKWIFISALAASSLLNAQDVNVAKAPETVKTEKPEQRAQRDANRASESLGLSPEQKAKWESAALERINANAPLKEKLKSSSSDGDKKQIRDQMRLNAKRFDETVSAFLSPEQKAKWDTQKQERKEKHKGRQQNIGH